MTTKQWVLVTGATSGIGLATALLLALHGYEVIATGRSEEKLNRARQAAEAAKVTIRRVLLDVTSEASIQEMKNEVLALTNGYGVDVLVNNAGYAEAGAIEEIPLQKLRQQFETNVFGLVAVTQAMLPLMRQRWKGKIINISSVLGKVSLPLMGAYTATKHAVEALSDAMRIELRGTGIDVVVVAPGAIQTNFGDTVALSVDEWMSPDSPYRDAYAKFQQDRRSDKGAHPTVIAEAVLEAIRAEQPKARYSAPLSAKAMPVLKALLPTRTVDGVMQRAILGGRPKRR